MAKALSNQQRVGRYRCGGYTDVNGSALGWWERVVFIKSPTDITFQLTQKYNHRPDLVAFDVYGRPDLQWFILQYNDMLDVIGEFVTGASITLPTKIRLFGEILVAAPKTSPV